MGNNLAVVVAKNGKIYQAKKLAKDANEFENLTSGGSGLLTDEQAKKLFTIPVQLNVLVNENPLVLDLIKRLNLSFEKNLEE